MIMGAAGRDFHNLNVVYPADPRTEVVAFTATQIPGIAARRYPPSLAGPLYPDGIPIVEESTLDELCRAERVDQVVFAYSDVSHVHVMHWGSRALAAGADFTLLGPQRTMLSAPIPVIAVSAVRTGCGKSQTTRWIAQLLHEQGVRIAVVRHPMPYGDLAASAVQRFATTADLTAQGCTIEEREEYEPHLALGHLVYAGVDYAKIVAQASTEADILLWDGGNNDFPFIRPDLHIALFDPLRAGHESSHHPGETVARMADVIIIAKTDSASPGEIERTRAAAANLNPRATVVLGASPVTVDDPEAIRGRRILVIEDGPTTTHGGMAYGAGWIAARRCGAGTIVDPRPYAAPGIAEVFERFPHLGPVLPAMGYSGAQIDALCATINHVPADVVLAGTPIDLARLVGDRFVAIDKPIVRAHYEFAEV
ncbi:MAG: cyclic 2,3-diphosphoglycerate synthase, partial [Burkholderiales bacterium]